MTIRTSGRSLVQRLETLTEFYEYEEPAEIFVEFWNCTMHFLKCGDETQTFETIYHRDDQPAHEPPPVASGEAFRSALGGPS